MIQWRDVALVLVGAQACHTVSHLWLHVSGGLPMELRWPRMTLTSRFNLFAIAVNVVVLAGLVWWLQQLSVAQ